MNDETRRFGFSPSPAHGRVPGPYTPLQDEPQDAGDICTAVGANMKTVPVPQIQSMKAYILKHHRQMIFDALNESIRAGALEMPADVDGGEIVLSAANCTFGAMNFWRYDKYTALAEVIVYPEICTDSGCVPCPLYVELWIDMESGMEFWTGACGYLRDMPERRHWRLSDYMIPILRKDEIEEGAEELLRAFCPNAATDRREHDPFVLAKRMGLNVERLPLYGRPHTLSMLFFCPETVMVQEFPATSKDDPPSPYPVTLPGNTILINTRAVHRDFCQLEIYHECIHYDWHFMFYRLQHMHNNDVSALRTRRAVVTDSSGSRNPLRWLE